MKYDDLTIRFGTKDVREPFHGHAEPLPYGDSDADFERRLPFPPEPHSFVGSDPHRNPEFSPFSEMENYDSLPTEAKLPYRLRGLVASEILPRCDCHCQKRKILAALYTF